AETGERQVEAEAQRLLGDLLAASGRGDPEPPLQRALAAARAQEARLFELRAACSLARLYHRQGRPDAGRAVLSPVYCWFTEGFSMPDLSEALRLLEHPEDG
ncbi:MAG TPA: hypothetical protein VFG62_13360, partial [Rhodopila sp.]|nr:hypothetical protein [Rhodopila sp.]